MKYIILTIWILTVGNSFAYGIKTDSKAQLLDLAKKHPDIVMGYVKEMSNTKMPSEKWVNTLLTDKTVNDADEFGDAIVNLAVESQSITFSKPSGEYVTSYILEGVKKNFLIVETRSGVGYSSLPEIVFYTINTVLKPVSLLPELSMNVFFKDSPKNIDFGYGTYVERTRFKYNIISYKQQYMSEKNAPDYEIKWHWNGEKFTPVPKMVDRGLD